MGKKTGGVSASVHFMRSVSFGGVFGCLRTWGYDIYRVEYGIFRMCKKCIVHGFLCEGCQMLYRCGLGLGE